MLWPNQMVLGNTLLRWILALGIGAGIFALVRLALNGLASWMERRAERTGRLFDLCLASLASHSHGLFIMAVAVTCGFQFLDLRPRLEHDLELLLPVALVLQVAAWGHWGVGLWIDHQFRDRPGKSTAGATRAAVLGFVLRLGLWSLVLLLALDVLGFSITTLVASLGIGGIAVALAVQNILGDLFASLSITIDQPFVIGDFIQLGNDPFLGAVEYIGLKTTRIRSLSGEQLVIANGELLKCRIRNYMKMPQRRVVFSFSVPSGTPPDLAGRIPGEIRRIIEAQGPVRFDRAHFFEFSETGFRFEVVYYVLGSDYNLYMDVQQAINLGILEAFRALGVGFSFPTRIVLRAGEGSRMGPCTSQRSPPPPPPGS
jgi:small-conductance mechanosensitive channel